MNEQTNHKLSMLMDGELDSPVQPVIDELLADPERRATWRRYHVISDVLTGNLPVHADTALAQKISAAIREENVLMAGPRFRRASLVKPLAGLAIAASVAAVAILGLQDETEQQPVALESAPIVAVTPTPASAPGEYTFPEAPVYDDEADADNPALPPNSTMNRYLINYSEFRTNGTTMQGVIPYVRIIANDTASDTEQ